MTIETNGWDEAQQAVLDLAAPCAASVIGPPGSGKTALAVEFAVRIVRDKPEAKIAVLSPDRRAASDLRNEISRTLGYLPGSVRIQSVTAFAFAIVSAYAQYVGRREPELLSGPDQDALLKEYFDLIVDGAVPGTLPGWAADSDAARLPAYRAEFRDLITRAAELELSAQELAALGERFDEPIWESGAQPSLASRTVHPSAASSSRRVSAAAQSRAARACWRRSASALTSRSGRAARRS